MNTFSTTIPCSPVSFDATHLTVADFDAPVIRFSQLMAELTTDDSDNVEDVKPVRHSPYSSAKSSPPRRRRKREAIDIPEDVANQYDPKEVKKIKNRIAAARLRERSQQKIRDLEAEVVALRARNAVLESLVATCDHCCTDETTTPVAAPCSPQSAPCSPVPSVQSPSTQSECAAMTHQEVMGEFESDFLHQLLWQSEEMSAMQMQL